MSTKTINLQCAANDITDVMNVAAQSLTASGYEVIPQPLSPTSATMVVKKDRDGFSNIIGLGVECSVNASLVNGMLTLNIDSEWGNKIIALAIGWFFCLIPFITGIVGCSNQYSLPGKIIAAFTTAAATANTGATPYQNGFAPQQPYYQPVAPQQPYNPQHQPPQQ